MYRVGGEGRDGVKALVLVIEGVQTGGGSLDEWMSKVDNLPLCHTAAWLMC